MSTFNIGQFVRLNKKQESVPDFAEKYKESCPNILDSKLEITGKVEKSLKVRYVPDSTKNKAREVWVPDSLVIDYSSSPSGGSETSTIVKMESKLKVS